LLHELQLLAREVGISEAGVYVCYTHPTASLEEFRMEGDVRRKPGPGMLLEAMRDFEASPEQTLFIGDRAEDQQAAKNAGIDFTPAGEFFS
jgi:D-glycero-D-manno-heptose 1,7-bisphosphate phosphatase